MELALQFVKSKNINGISHADKQLFTLLAQHYGSITPRIRFRQQRHQRFIVLKIFQVYKRHTQLFRQKAEQPLFLNKTLFNQNAA